MATGSFWPSLRNGMDGDPEFRIRIREIRKNRKFFFASTDLLGPQVRPRMDRNHLIRIRIRGIRFFRKSGFFENTFFLLFFAFLSLKPQQYGCLWTRLDLTRSLVPVLRYLTVLNGIFSVMLGWSAYTELWTSWIHVVYFCYY